MRFSSLAILAPMWSVLMTVATVAVDAENNALHDQAIAATEPEQASRPVHRVPALWNFELDKEFSETPELIGQMEEAFLLSANEVHSSADITFLSAFVRSSTHETLDPNEVDNDKKKRKRMMMLPGQEVEPGEDYDEEEEDQDAEDAAASPNLRMNWSINIRPKNSKNNPMLRPNYTTNLSVACRFCSDDDAVAVSARPLEQGNLFYELQEGQDIHEAWQRKFCQKLRAIPALQGARRCFIYLDLDHIETADDTLAAASSSMFTVAQV